MKTLRMIVPNGSLWQRLAMYLAIAGYTLREPDRTGFCGCANGVEFFQADRRMIPGFVEVAFDAGITGYDLLLASGIKGLREVANLCFSRASDRPSCWVLARRKGFRRRGKTVTIACELPRLATILLRRRQPPFRYRIVRIDGSEELCVKERLADMALVVTESGTSIRANSLEIVPGFENLLASTPRILARRKLPVAKEEALLALSTALFGVVGASDVVMLTFDISTDVDIEAISLPSAVAPTVTRLTREGWNACQTCIPRSAFGRVSMKLKKLDARAIAMQRIEGYLL